MFSLSGKTAIVTGAGSGIGEAIARMFVEAGARVVIADLDEANGLRVATEIDAEFEVLDVSSHADRTEFASREPTATS